MLLSVFLMSMCFIRCSLCFNRVFWCFIGIALLSWCHVDVDGVFMLSGCLIYVVQLFSCYSHVVLLLMCLLGVMLALVSVLSRGSFTVLLTCVDVVLMSLNSVLP